MAQQIINNEESGLVVRTKINENTTELYGQDDAQQLEIDANTAKVSYTDAAKMATIEEGAEVNNISDVNATELTDGSETNLHKHDLLVEQNASVDTKIWVGTQAQYDALTPDADTLYFIKA
jgi:hypothetical protein